MPNIQIRKRDFSVTPIVVQPLCHGSKGTVVLQINDVRPQYYVTVKQGGVIIESRGPDATGGFQFNNMNPGVYDYTVTTDDGCITNLSVTIIEPAAITATSALTKPLTCIDGEITVTTIGGTPPYSYFVNSATVFQGNPQIEVTNLLPSGGVYTIRVVDSNNCEATTSITVAAVPPPVYTMSQTNIICYNDNAGIVNFNVTNANGYTLAYSIDNGVTYLPTPTFSNLFAGTYNTIVRYTLGTAVCYGTMQAITITGPSSAVTASAGVSELAGCGPSGEGKIRITNPQGGTAPYEYSFDNQVTWTTVNDAYKAPGTYTVYIRDANGCIFAMPNIIIDPKPVEPTIQVEDAVFNCDGTATSTVTVTNNGGVNYSYQYLLDGVPNTNVPPNVFTNVPSGTHTVSVSYSLLSVPTYSNLLKEDFGSGAPTTTSGIASAYCFNDQRVLAPYPCGTRSVEDNQYSVASFFWRPDDPTSNNSGAWYHFKDHTSNGTNVNGRYLLVNIGSAAGPYGVLYSKPIVDIIPNQDIKVDLYLANLIRASRTGAKPDFIIELVNGSGTVVASQATGIIENNEIWNLKSLSLNPGNNTNLTFNIRSGSILYNGNDALIDDIIVYQLPKSCITTKDFTITVSTGKAFDASVTGFKNVSCSGANDGTITIAVQNFNPTNGFQYSINNGTTWNTQLTSPYTITSLAAANYTILIRYDATSTGTCLKTFSQIITAPTPVTVTASATTLATCSTGATITAIGAGGTLAYQYELRDAAGVVVIRPYQLNAQFTNVPVGNYTVFVKDANGCISAAGAALNVVAPPTLTATLDAGSDICFDSVNQASLIVNVSGGTPPFTYSLNGAAAQNSNSFINVGTGTHNIVVTDSNNCTAAISNIIIAPQLIGVANTTKTLDCTTSPNAVITGTISGGTAPFTVTVLSGTGPGTIAQPTATTFNYTTAIASTYQFQIQDANGCITTTTATVNSLVPITATTTNVNPSCNGALDGSVQIIPSGGVGPYTYSFDGSPFTATSLYSNLKAGILYAYEVRDSKNCPFTGTVILSEPTTLVTSATATAFSCSATNTKQSATITIEVPTSGTAPYQYSFNGSGYTNVNTLTLNDNGTDQIISYSVKDAKGCIYANTITILKLDSPTDLSFSAAPITCTATTTTVTATATNGVGTLTYSIIFPLASATSNTTGIFAGLSPGTYIFKVTDANGCYYTESHIVNPVIPIAVIATKLTDVDCFGNSIGSIRYNVSGFGTTYSYSINGNPAVTGQTAAVFSLPNLVAATYNVVFTDETTGCIASTSITITQPAAALSATIAQVNANCFIPTSQVTVTALGGTPNYLYSFVQDGASAGTYILSNIANLDPAINLNWDVWVKDANGCTIKYDIVITTDSVPAVTASALGQCLGAGSYTITATGSGGVGTLTYSINNGGSYQAGNTFVVVTAGSYTIRVKDANGCTADSTPVMVAPQLTLSAVLNKGITCNPAPTTAQITITATGGTAPFTYESKEASGSYTAMASNVFNSSVAGSYTFRVTDANGCIALTSTPIVTTLPVNPDITGVTQTQFINCNGEATAAISIAVDNTKGQAPFVFNVYNNTLSIDYGTQTSGLRAGNYTITITDAKGCTDTFAYVINEPLPIDFDLTKVDITCDAFLGTSLGSISVENVSGGTGPFKYFISNNFGDVIVGNPYAAATNENHTFMIINYGLYTVNVVDANGCSLSKQITIASPPSDLTIDVTTVISDCISGGTAIVKVISLVGSGNYEFGILETNTIPYSTNYQTSDAGFPDTKTFTNLIPGVIYTFVIHDLTTNCYYVKSADFPIAPASTLTSTVVPNNVSCKGANDGSVTFTISNFDATTTSVDYQIFTAFSNIPVGPIVNLPVTFGTPATVTTPSPGNLPPGRYYVQFIENGTGSFNGCKSASTAFDIVESSIDLSVTATKIKNVNCNQDGIIAAQAKDGTAPYTYQYLPASAPAPIATTPGWTANTTFATSVTGNYIVYVKDAYGCIRQAAVTMDADDAPTITSPIVPICYDGSTPFTINIIGTVDPDIVGGATYSVNGSAFQTSSSFTFNAAGLYNLVIKDGNGCTANVDYEVYPKLDLSASLTKELDCTATPAATITLTASGGDTTPAPNYTYEVSFNSGAFAAASNPFTATTAGNYVFRVTDANNSTLCQATTSFVLDPIPGTTFTTTPTNVSCFGGADGTITVNVTSGVGPYEYQLDAGIFQPSNVFTGLAAGTAYVVTVRNAKNCTLASTPIMITAPVILTATSAITTPLTCGAGNAAQPATVTVNGVDGTAPYQYSFDGGLNYTATNTYQSYVGITFDVFVKDAKGCLFTLPNGVNIPALVPPTDLSFVSTAVTCLALTSNVTLTTTNGVGALSYAIVSPASATSNVTGASSGIFTGLMPDTYLFQVTDANFCTYQESYTVNPVTNITVSGQLISNVTCNPGTNGEVRFTVGNFAGTYSYSLDGGTTVITGQTNPTITVSGLSAASTQTIVVTDEVTGCTATTFIDVTQPAPLALVANPFINANCNFGAQVSVTASGGVAPYSYSYVISGAPAGTYSTSASAVLDPAIATSWDVYVKDANNCVITTPLPITIATDPLPSGITVSGLSQCPSATGTYTFTVNVATGVGPFEYSIGSGFQTSPTFTVNAPGTYNVIVKDANGCSTTETGLVVILPALQLQATITALPSCTDGDGTLTLLTTGGSGNYEYSIDSGTYQVSTNFTNIFAGTHTLTVRDVTTNCTKSIPVTFSAATPITGFALSKTDVTCNGGNDGTITATMSTPAVGVNDNPVYTYSIDGGTTTQNSNIFSGLIAGTYTVEVTSGRGCVATQTITVNEPAIITVPAPAVVQFGCNSGSNAMNFATITVTGVTGGSGVYNYEFIKGGTVVQFGASNVYTEANLLGGIYTVNVYDNKGCMGTAPATITIVPFIALDEIDIAVNNAITCTNLEDITVSVTSIGGTPTNLQYTVADSNATTGVIGANYNFTNTTGIFTGLNIGNYIITVENLDTGCSIQSVHYVNNSNTFDLTINNIVDVTCFGDTNGSANVTIIDRTITATNPDQAGPFSYTIVDALGNPVTSGTTTNAGPITINALAAGTFSITATLTNSPYCGVTKNFTINQPNAALTIAETHTAITCISGNNDGSISATAIGGWPGGYQFQLERGATVVTPWSSVTNFTGLTQGTYTVRVRDTKGCSVFVDVILVNPTPIVFTATPSTTLLSCFGDTNASITVSLPTGGQGSNYLYALNTTSIVPAIANGPQASPIFSGLGAGTYTITVTDGWGCSATSSAPIVIAEPTVVTASLVVATTQTCNNQTTLTLSAVGGTPPYTYSSDGITYNATTFNPSVTFPVAVGTHHYYVKDANGCTSYVSNDIQIDQLPALIINLDLSNALVNCAGDATGVIVATAQGGLGNYVYTLQDAAGNPLPAAVQASPGVFTQLVAGDYRVQVSSLDCATTSALISVTEPSTPLVATYVATDATCNGANNGTITINASGGTGIIKYAISPRLDQFFVSNVFELLQPGVYEIIAQDQNGCYVHTTGIEIAEPTLIIPSVDPLTIIPELCFGDKDGAFMIDITGGTAPYSVSLDNINGPFISGTATQTQFDFTGLAGGDHTVYIRDANLCNAELTVPLPASVKLNPNAIVDYGCLNNSPSLTVTVTIDASITNPADVDYALDGSGSYQASNVFTNVSPGFHFITARHTNGCEKDTPNFEILQINPLTLVLSDGGLNEIVATTTGGSPGYRYTLNGEDYGSQNTFIFYKSGDYTVTVTDSNGCVATATRYFEFVDIKIPNVFTPNGDGDNDGWLPTNTMNYPDLIFHIFDRYGRKVGTYREGQFWDGKYNGLELPTGDYWYVLKLQNENDSREFVGHFTLYR
ncbi:MAG TPA: T9SS type B sorting domain-containing protein [Flavobacterium sp.]|nr:T9SS type B sorting domain-containing protein [Flavobacterium sp.]